LPSSVYGREEKKKFKWELYLGGGYFGTHGLKERRTRGRILKEEGNPSRSQEHLIQKGGWTRNQRQIEEKEGGEKGGLKARSVIDLGKTKTLGEENGGTRGGKSPWF